MRRYRAVQGKEAGWQTEAVKAALRLFRGLFEITDGKDEKKERSGGGETVADRGRICFPGFAIPVGNPEMDAGPALEKNLKRVQRENGIRSVNTGILPREERCFTMEMPEGEGRFFVMLRMILEMNRALGLTKFIVVVPSVAARMSLEESVRKLSGCMTALGYPDPAQCVFPFNGERTGEVSARLVESKGLSVCIMNMQAFNRATNRLRAKDEYGQVLWEDICAVRPAIMVDEPRRIEGSGCSSKSLEAMKGLNPLFTIRFESEPWRECNKIFSYSLTQALAEGAVRAPLSVPVPERPSAESSEKIQTAETGEQTERIRAAVELHFQAQLSLFREGRRVKALTLFFTEAEKKQREEILAEFDREYAEAAARYEEEMEPFFQTLQIPEMTRQPEKVRRVFLGLDRKGRERELDGWDRKESGSWRKRLTEDVNRGIGQLLRAGEELKNFDRTESFLFVHPALREGCRNSSLFVICSLDTGSERAYARETEGFLWPCEDQEGRAVTGGTASYFQVIGGEGQQSHTQGRPFREEKRDALIQMAEWLHGLGGRGIAEAVGRLDPEEAAEAEACARHICSLLGRRET